MTHHVFLILGSGRVGQLFVPHLIYLLGAGGWGPGSMPGWTETGRRCSTCPVKVDWNCFRKRWGTGRGVGGVGSDQGLSEPLLPPPCCWEKAAGVSSSPFDSGEWGGASSEQKDKIKCLQKSAITTGEWRQMRAGSKSNTKSPNPITALSKKWATFIFQHAS